MALITWTPELSVGVKDFDEQHQKLIALINRLHEEMRAGKAKEAIGKILQELLDYTDYHFGLEEKAFEKYGYPEAAEQKAQHRHFIARIQDLIDKQKSGSLLVSVDALDFLNDWLVNHIQIHDKRYADFFKGKSL
jgi:hemerythrin-like metal-binding protein